MRKKKNSFPYSALVIFSVAMGFLEAIVVIYVRELYYPNGFEFPLKALPQKIVFIEIVREFSTLFMLGAVAWISGKKFVQQFSAFLFTFGVWDITFYLVLKLFINWPASFFTWDILFLIPITWVGPVAAPLICSVLMIVIAVVFNRFYRLKNITALKFSEWLFMIIGAFIIFMTFISDFLVILIKGRYLNKLLSLPENPEFIATLTTYQPERFLWIPFFVGIIFITSSLALVILRAKKTTRTT